MLPHERPLNRDDFLRPFKNYMEFVDKELLDERGLLDEEYEYLRANFFNWDHVSYNWTVEKVRILFEIFKLADRDKEEKILSYMQNIRYGWKGDKYILRNWCHRFDQHCKQNHKIDNTPEMTERAFGVIRMLFFNKEFGDIMTYIFGYCISALFYSKMKRENLRVPYFLQIACERNSNLYKLIHEIVDICDVNTGLLEKCRVVRGYGSCDYDHTTVFPTQHTASAIEELACNRDIPVIIDGYENEKFYDAMLREIANIPGKKKILGIQDRFHVLPVFICPVIRSSFKNVFNMSLTDCELHDEYLEFVKQNKQWLASWVLELVKEATDYFAPRKTTPQETSYDLLLRKRRQPEEELPFFDDISSRIDWIRTKYRQHTTLDLKDIKNIGFLSFFFHKYMKVFQRSIKLTEGTVFKFKGLDKAHNTGELIEKLTDQAINSLVKLHLSNSPMLSEKVSIETKNLDDVQEKRVKKKGEEYAKDIVKYYLSYGVSIRILPNAEFENARYIFHVSLLPGTDKNLIHRYADEVRRLLGLEFFMPDVGHSAIKIIASEKPLKENSLLNILESQKFIESTMKIPYAVGYDMMGEMVVTDIAEFPHLMVGGATGFGKSSALHSLLMSIVCKQKADAVRLMLLDFGASRLNMFANVPHLLGAVVTAKEVEKGRRYITVLRREMQRRQNIFEHSEKELDKLPSIVCVIDEFPAFIRGLTAGKENREAHTLLIDLLERARKVKIHLILAAQDSTKGNIKIKMTNLAAAIAFRCTNWRDSMAILDEPDAAKLSGKGSMYFKCYQHEGLLRVQGAYMEPEEIRNRLQNMEFDRDGEDEFELEGLDEQRARPDSGEDNADSDTANPESKKGRQLTEIIIWALSQTKISNNQIKKNFYMGFDMAEKFMDELEAFGIVEAKREGAKLPRFVVPKRIEEIRPEVMVLLAKYGYTEESIAGILDKSAERGICPVAE